MYQSCRLCPHQCGVNRSIGEIGRCKMTFTLKVARACLHQWEEPPISGKNGSGTVFFSGCPLSCVYCQNHEISHKGYGVEISEDDLIATFLRLQQEGAHNINLVTATHFIPSVVSALYRAKAQGLSIPIVYNTSGYESPESLQLLEGVVDIYLADLRYMRQDTAKALSHAPNYPEVAKKALSIMAQQVGDTVIDSNGIMQKGVIVRLLLLPGHLIEAKMALRYLVKTYGNKIYISLMNQYTPLLSLEAPLNRTVTEQEYHSFLAEAQSLNVEKAFVQEASSASAVYVPPFFDKGLLGTV